MDVLQREIYLQGSVWHFKDAANILSLSQVVKVTAFHQKDANVALTWAHPEINLFHVSWLTEVFCFSRM